MERMDHLRDLVDAQLRVCELEVGTLAELSSVVLTSYRALESQAKVIQNFVRAEPSRRCTSLKDSLADARDVNATIVQLDGALVALIGKVEEIEGRAQ